MSLTPRAYLPRPETAHLTVWQQAGVNPAFAFILDELWQHRVVAWVGVDDPTIARLDALWSELADISTPDGLLEWTASVRQLMWNHARGWIEHVECEDPLIYQAQYARAVFLLGRTVLDWVADDDWRERYERLLDAEVSYEDLRRLAVKRTRERVASHPLHPEPEGGYSLRRIRAQAQALAGRFGLRHIRTAGGMPLGDVWSALREAEVGLGAMAHELRWVEADLGANRLGLSFELEAEGKTAGSYDGFIASINIGRRSGWGSFAHEWGHAIDEAVGLGWSPKVTDHRRYASVRAEDPSAVVPTPYREELAAWRSREVPVLTHGQSFLALHASLDRFPGQLQAFAARVPHKDWEDRLARRLDALAPWLHAVRTGVGMPRQWAKQWQRWKQDNHVAFAPSDSKPGLAWKAQWDRTVEVAERVFFTPWPGQPAWRVWSAARDAAEPQPYWNLPHEAFARLIHALVRQSVGTDTWAAETPLLTEIYPQGADLAAAKAWWFAQSDLVLRHWRNPPKVLALSWAGMALPLR